MYSKCLKDWILASKAGYMQMKKESKARFEFNDVRAIIYFVEGLLRGSNAIVEL
jgi:hypothetical protein